MNTNTTTNNTTTTNTNNNTAFEARAKALGQRVEVIKEVIKAYPFRGGRVVIKKVTSPTGLVTFEAECGGRGARSTTSATVAERQLLRKLAR